MVIGMSEQPPKPRHFDPNNRPTVALAAGVLVWIILFLILVLFTSLGASTSAWVALALATVVFLTGLGFHITAAFYAMVLEICATILMAIAAMLAALFAAFS